MVLHRILRLRADGMCFIAGDNCESGEWVRQTDILGVLTQVRRGKKIISAQSLSYKLYARFQAVAFPLRRLYRRQKRRVLRLWQRVWTALR